jgi:hypothetical protein
MTNRTIDRAAVLAILLLAFTCAVGAQPATQKVTSEKPAALATDAVSLELAKATLAAHGGDKLKALRSMVIKGSVDMNVMGQTMAGAFSNAFSGEKYFFELLSPVQSLKQVYNGKATYTSVQGFYLPPVASMGFPVLAHVGDAGFVISDPGDAKKKGKGFRVTTPEGYYTDFIVDEKTHQLKGYESSYDMGGGRTVTTAVTLDEFETVEGVLAPKRFAQRFDLGTITAYVNFKAKTILINSPIDDSAFAMPK